MLKHDIKKEVKGSLNTLPLGCEGRIVSFDASTNKGVIEVFDEGSGKRVRYTNVEAIAQNATVLNTMGTMYKPGDYVYVGWIGGQKTNPVIIGYLRAQIGSFSSLYSANPNGTDYTSSPQNAPTTTTTVAQEEINRNYTYYMNNPPR